MNHLSAEKFSHTISNEESLAKNSQEFEGVFSVDALHILANEDPLLKADVDTLISNSRVYVDDLRILGDALKHNIDTHSILERQNKHHTNFVEALQLLVLHAREQGKDIPYDVSTMSRSKSAQLALFIAYENGNLNEETYGSFKKSA
jgi:hypothetical protein